MGVVTMIKTWVNKALILAYVTLFCFLGISTNVNAERLFILQNISDTQTLTTVNYHNLFDVVPMVNNHKYYYSVSRVYNGNVNQKTGAIGSIYFATQDFYLLQSNPSNYIDGHFSNVLTYNKYTGNMPLFVYGSSTSSSVNTVTYSNFILIDLTEIFGYGSEPSLQDFELYYLPDIDYFNTYNSFEPDITKTISDLNYTNIQENLTGIDYTKSIIDNDGKNIDLDLSLYFYDTVVNGTTVSGRYIALYYKSFNKPIMYYNGVEYELSWDFSDYSQRVLILDLTDEQELILKKILFNRNIDRDQEYFNLKVETDFSSYAKLWFTIGSKFDLLVDVKSFLLSHETITENDFNIINEMYIKTYDTEDNLLLPSLKMTIADLFRTVYVDNFGSQYTNISKFNFEFLLVSPDKTDDYEFENHYFYEIGIFSSDKVLHPSFIESDIDSLWDYKTCDWYQIGCHLSNFFNDVLTTIYNKLNIDAIIAFFDGIIDDVTQVVDTVPSGVKTVFAVLFTGLGVALIIVIIEKMNR